MATNANPGFAFVVNNILNSNNAKLLSKAKKDEVNGQVETKQSTDDVELVDEAGNVIKSDEVVPSEPITTKSTKRKSKPSISRKEMDLLGKVRPNQGDRVHEKELTMIATKGVVQLFNIVRDQKKKIKVDRQERKSPQFKQAKRSLNESNDSKNQSNKKWKVLQNDFMTGAKLKDWDKESDSDSN